jgi:hypothetical protein
MKKQLALIVFLCIFVVGCVTTSPEQRELADELFREYEASFNSAIKDFFGVHIEVVEARTAMRMQMNPVWPSGTLHATTDIIGTVRDGDMEHSVRYCTLTGAILSDRNRHSIAESLKGILEQLIGSVIDFRISYGNGHGLFACDVSTFEQVLGTQEFIGVIAVTTSSLAHLTENDFLMLVPQTTAGFTFSIYQIQHDGIVLERNTESFRQVDVVEQLMTDGPTIRYGFSLPTLRHPGTDEVVCAFEYYGILSSVSVSTHNPHHGETLRVVHLHRTTD